MLRIKLWVLAIVLCSFSVVAKEFCENEIFEANCGPNEVITMETANYGQMRSQRCLEDRLPFPLGCSVDVRAYFDQWCSGRPSCEVPVANLLRGGLSPCEKNFRSYLEASFRCVPVIHGPPSGCSGATAVDLPMPVGYISNYIARKTGCGSIDSPWLITAKPGQKLNVTLWDFSAESRVVNSPKRPSETCIVYVVIKETYGAAATTVCSGNHRVDSIFLSVSNSIEIRLTSKTRIADDTEYFFLLKYEAIGCPDPELPEDGWLVRRGNEADIGCKSSQQTWTLQCRDQVWIGTIGECQSAITNNSKMRDILHLQRLPGGVSVIVVAAVAVVVGLLVLCIGIPCLRRRHARKHRENVYSSTARSATNIPTLNTSLGIDPEKANTKASFIYDRENYRTLEMNQEQAMAENTQNATLSQPHYTTDKNLIYDYNRPCTEHVYESPKFEHPEQESTILMPGRRN